MPSKTPSAVQKIIIKALQELHDKSHEPEDERWFTRAQVAKQLEAPSFRLNPSRKNALDALYENGEVERRTKPNDGRGMHQYRLKK
jgi:hypothetical protein